MPGNRIIIIGTGGHAGVVIDALHKKPEYEIVGLLDDFIPKHTFAYGHRTLGSVEDSKDYPDCLFFIAVGDSSGRETVYKRIRSIANLSASIIHPRSHMGLWSTAGMGTFVASGACVATNCHIGGFSILNTNSSLDHDSTVGEFSHLAPGVVTGGHVTIGNQTLIGLAAMIRDRVKIGNHCTIGMGSVVLEDVPDGCTAWGNPCRIIKRP